MLIAHLTDPHLGLAPALNGALDPSAALRRALAHVRQLPTPPELLLLSGFGVLGFLMRRYDYPVAPVIVGLILVLAGLLAGEDL